MEATIEEITAALARMEARLFLRIDTALRDLETHIHQRFDVLEASFDRMENRYTSTEDARVARGRRRIETTPL